MAIIRFVLLILMSFRESSAASCNFYYNINGYNCDLYDVSVQSESDMLEITGNHLEGYNNTRVDFVNVLNHTMAVLHKNILETFPNVQSLTISSIGLQRIPDQAFGWCSKLEYLFIEPNPLTTLQAGVFGNCNELTGIYIRNGNLKDVSPTVFHGLGKLRAVNFENNSIASLDAGIFEQNANLIIVNLNGNKISRFDPSTFAHLVNLLFLELMGNSIQEIGETMFESLHSLTSLYLQNCDVKKIHSNAFKNLEALSALHLQNNNLETIEPGTFAPLKNLRALYLNENKIRRLNANAFGSSHPSATILELTSTQLDEVEEGLFDAFPKLMYVDATGNICIDQLVTVLSKIPDEFKECYENWVTPRATTLPGSTIQTSTQGAASVNISIFVITSLLFILSSA